MIRINLLPKEITARVKKKQRNMLIGLLVVFAVLMFVGVYMSKVTKLTTLNGEIKKVQRELDKLKPVVQKVEALEKNKNRLHSQIKVINTLMKSRLDYPRFMEYFASVLPAGVWINTFDSSTSNGRMQLKLSVMAKDNYAVADFINLLETSSNFDKIEFSGITTTLDSQGKEARSFNIICSYVFNGPEGK